MAWDFNAWPVRRLKASQKDAIKILSDDFSASLFKEYWGQKPVLVRKAFSLQQDSWPAWELIEEIAGYDNSEARLIGHVPNDLSSFDLEIGPFRDLSCLKERGSMKWTLVVNDVDRFQPDLADWIDCTFDFIPRWRRDDAQVSLAQKDGGIGPHVDNYDVFLIQTSGKREWCIGCDKISVEDEFDNLVQEIPVRILKNWENILSCSLILEPGDVLYLPPRIPHCGTALTDKCITLSVGCRAPSASELTQRVASELSSRATVAATLRFKDDDLLQESDATTPAELTLKEKEKMKDLILNAVQEFLHDDAQYDKMVGQLVTEPKRSRDEYPVPLDELDSEMITELGVWGIPKKAIEEVCGGSGSFYRAEGVSATFSKVSEIEKTKHRLFMNGEMFELESIGEEDPAVHELFSSIVSSTPAVSCNVLQPICHDQRVYGLIEMLLQNGLLYGSESD
eukprot:CAMPEP_0194217018 /NCGR_PEP_ID=MMETSP0156-20130528/20148_1 /TAXON_ID=33649 /ORGANISM="Thalassionema nitzschioides, Strain L26-B" /LENGTH=451 /DNA_ID=CAMNT_0038945927 /DNA_START=301 /DNA_END=1657 /DNA_ORIENTATION=+